MFKSFYFNENYICEFCVKHFLLGYFLFVDCDMTIENGHKGTSWGNGCGDYYPLLRLKKVIMS